MEAAHQHAASLGLQAKRQALLIIHGIGEQNPYETLDSFARGVFHYLRDTKSMNAKLCPIEIAHKDWTQVGMRIGVFEKGRELPKCPDDFASARLADEPAANVDIFEYYWAPLTEDKLSAVQTVKWVLFTDLTPLKYFADNLQEMIGAQHLSWLRALWKALSVYARELARVLLLYIPLAAGMGLLLQWLSKTHSWTDAVKNITAHSVAYLTVPHAAILLVYFLFVLMSWFGLQGLWELRQYPGAAIETIGDVVWLALDGLGATLFLLVALEFDLRPNHYVAWHVLRRVFGNGHWQPLVGAAVAAIISYAMTAYVADVAVYTNMDAKSKNFAARNAILDGSTAALKALLSCGQYDRVILAGHSLGSVIAYDTINEILAQSNAGPGPADDRPSTVLSDAQIGLLKGLVTFGCPLDKIYYFFREHVKRDQAIRAQVLSMLHSFRKVSSGRDYGEFTFNYKFAQLDDLIWMNAWARMDFVSGRLQFYDVNDRKQFHYPVPALAHLRYWSDPEFYEYFCGRLLVGPAAPPSPPPPGAASPAIREPQPVAR
jgi:hypothetical protein